MSVKPIPEGYSTVCPYLVCDNASAVLDFILKTFDAEDRGAMRTPEGKIAHGEVKIGDTVVMLSDGSPQYPKSPSIVHVYVEDCDITFAKSLSHGGSLKKEPETMFYGDRGAAVTDPGGNTWWISTRVEDVSPEEMERRMKESQK